MTGRQNRFLKRALLSALFSFLTPWSADADDCGADGIRERARVAHVFDGDTLRLEDGRRVRLIGIDAPELARDERPAEPYADRARGRLIELIGATGGRIGLRPGADARDDYGRWLAHTYDERGRNLSAALLGEGLAVILPVAPNLTLADCYRDSEQQARLARRGLWDHPDYRERPAAALDERDIGAYRVVRGRISRVGHSRSSVWLNLGDDVALRIHRSDLERFPWRDWDALAGTELRARGQVYARNGQLRIRIRDADLIELLD